MVIHDKLSYKKNMIELEIKNISKSFRNESVLNDISLYGTGGHIYGIVGRNGSGKSVLFKLICGLMIPDNGSILVNGKYVGKDIDFPENIGVLIESPGFLWYQSGYSNLAYLAGIRKKIGKKEVCDVMRLVGLDPFSKKIFAKYSLGMKQRLGIAQAIMEDPDIIILDEPMNGLDETGVEEMRQLFLNLKSQGKLILLASHNKEDINVLCDKVFELKNGKLTLLSKDK
jgi:ABC-2 type transport system ATP-binding protein